jgi:hypothetical protein
MAVGVVYQWRWSDAPTNGTSADCATEETMAADSVLVIPTTAERKTLVFDVLRMFATDRSTHEDQATASTGAPKMDLAP